MRFTLPVAMALSICIAPAMAGEIHDAVKAGATDRVRALVAANPGGDAVKTFEIKRKPPGVISNVLASGVDLLWLRSAARPGGAAELIIR